MEQVTYGPWSKCLRLTDGRLELVITTEVGPRIIRCGFVGRRNLFGEVGPDIMDGEWRLYGGHRLWHSPEIRPRSYAPDNDPIQWCEIEGGVRLQPRTEATTGIRKELEVALRDGHAEVTHRLHNCSLWPVELAPWALTVMAQRGMAIVAHPQGDPDALLPNRTLTLWPYTDMADPRVTWGTRYIVIRQDPSRAQRFKVGLNAAAGWAAYLLGGELFLKRFPYVSGACYPDGGCSCELFTNDLILEVESLGPLTALAPGCCVEHVEHWHLFEGIHTDGTEASLDSVLAPCLEAAFSG